MELVNRQGDRRGNKQTDGQGDLREVNIRTDGVRDVRSVHWIELERINRPIDGQVGGRMDRQTVQTGLKQTGKQDQEPAPLSKGDHMTPR